MILVTRFNYKIIKLSFLLLEILFERGIYKLPSVKCIYKI